MFKINTKEILGVSVLKSSRLQLCWSTRFLFQVGFVVSWIILTALFVEQFGIHNLLWFFLFDAGLYLVGAGIASFLAPRIALRKYLIIAVAGTLALVGGSFFFEPTDIRFFVLVILAKDLFFSQINIGLHRLTEHLFSPSQAQRFMPKIESAITIGSVVGTLLMVMLLEMTSDQSVLWLWIVALVGMGGIFFFMPKILHTIPTFHRSDEEKPCRNPIHEAVHGVKKIKFLRHLLMLILLQMTVFTIIEFEFIKEIQSYIIPEQNHIETQIPSRTLQASFFTNVLEKTKTVQHVAQKKVHTISSRLIMRKSLAHDLGMFQLFFALFALGIQFFVTPKVLQKLGVIGSMFSYFMILFLGLAFAVLGYGGAGWVRAFQHGTHSLGESAYHISFYSIFSHSREAVRLFIEGIIRPLGIGLGVLFLFIVPTVLAFPIALALTVVLLGFCMPSRKSFTQLSKQNLDAEENIEGKLHSVEVLGQKGHLGNTGILSHKLTQKDEIEIVREKIIRTIATINDPKAVHIFLNILRDENESIDTKIHVADSLFHLTIPHSYWNEHAFTQHHLRETLEKLFHQVAHPHLKKLLVMNIFKHSPSHQVVPFFIETMEKADDKLKSIYLRSCQMFNDPEIVFYVRKYLEHDDPRIKSHAVIALWKFEEQEVLKEILRKLLESEQEKNLISALYAIGEVRDRTQHEAVLEFIDHQSDNTRLHALIALAKLGDSKAQAGLLEIIFGENPELSKKAFYMLDRVSPEMRSHIRHHIRTEVSYQVGEILQVLSSEASEKESLLGKLRWFYQMAGRHDDIVAMGRMGK